MSSSPQTSGFSVPSPVQFHSLPRSKLGLDLVVQAKAGTGKTLVFVVTALEALAGRDLDKRKSVAVGAGDRGRARRTMLRLRVKGARLLQLRVGYFNASTSFF